MNQSRFSLFGGYLKSARESRDWSLEQLAKRVRTDRANIHRIESGKARPQFDTVARLVKALNATPNEAIELYERAGYQAPLWPTTAADFAAIRADLHQDWLVDGPPATVVIDVFWTIWYANSVFARLFTCCEPGRLTGLHYLALFLDPAYGFREALSQLATEADVDALLAVVMARFRRRLLSGRGAIKSERELARLKQLPGFTKLWSRTAPGQALRGDDLAGIIRVALRDNGCLFLASSTVLRDRRFFFTYYLPADEGTAAALGARLAP